MYSVIDTFRVMLYCRVPSAEPSFPSSLLGERGVSIPRPSLDIQLLDQHLHGGQTRYGLSTVHQHELQLERQGQREALHLVRQRRTGAVFSSPLYVH